MKREEINLKSMPIDLARKVLDAAPDAIILIDASGVIQFANIQVSTLFGYSRDDITGQPVERLMPERFRTLHAVHRNEYHENKRVRSMGAGLNLFGLRRDGTEFPVEISLSPIEEAGRTLVAAAIRDVSDNKRVEAELIAARKAANISRELADQAREIADRANLGKSRFLATASHDLRQPLQTLALLNGTLRRVVTDADSAAVLTQQERAIGAMSRLLNSLLDISKIESGAIKPELLDFNVASIFEELRAEFASIAADKGLQLQIEPCQDRVHSDPSLVEQILRNILSNAIKYTREGLVQLRCLHEVAFLRIEVLDTGIGIPTEQLAHIWEDFYQVGVPANTSRHGYGLGLSIVQRLVKLLALKIDVHSEPGKGSVFSLLLPVSEPKAHSEEVNVTDLQVSRLHLGKIHVLLVEDDKAVRAATEMLLKVEGYRVTSVESLAESVKYVRDGNIIDLLITDYHLGGGETGLQVIAALREAQGTLLRTVLVTGDTSGSIKKVPRDPHLRLVSKPVNADELLAILRALLTS
ncbi:MAG: PAS domain S-box protein [Gammaproteobacteria bacterium]